jgi:hypothetical protein
MMCYLLFTDTRVQSVEILHEMENCGAGGWDFDIELTRGFSWCDCPKNCTCDWIFKQGRWLKK